MLAVMSDLILTGASRGLGRALSLALAPTGVRLVLVSRDRGRLETLAAEVAARGGRAVAVAADLSSLATARAVGEHLAGLVGEDTTLVHGAGVWPHRRELTAEGFETAFAVNHLGPLACQAPLLAARRLRRVMAVSAGLIALGRFDPERTPTGRDFSTVRTYCTTKLCFALAMRDLAAAHPELDVVALHPGVIRTGLGARPGPLGWLLALVKRSWEAPEAAAVRLARILGRDRWSPPGEARWLVLEEEKPWPAAAEDPDTRRAVRETTAALLSPAERRRAG
jgi:NAD(P)-dependent dehydrogenase (short-subunit alcohol dehydrogenase family)